MTRSGLLNSKHRELVELQKESRTRLESARVKIDEGWVTAKEVKGDLKWIQKRMEYVVNPKIL